MLAPGPISPQATKYKETYEDKNNCMHVQLGVNSGPRDTERSGAQLPLLKSRKQKQGTVPVPLYTTPQRWANHPKPPLSPDSWTYPYLHLMKGTSLPPWEWASKATCCCIWPDFLSGLWSNFYWWGGQNPVGKVMAVRFLGQAKCLNSLRCQENISGDDTCMYWLLGQAYF